MIMTPLVVFCDDTSGNKSKDWNKFESFCVLLAGLPLEQNTKLQNINFVCTSNKVPVMEIAYPLVDQLKILEDGIIVYDAYFSSKVIVVAPIICILCDNPMGAMICSHLGANTHLFYRICTVSMSSIICSSELNIFFSID